MSLSSSPKRAKLPHIYTETLASRMKATRAFLVLLQMLIKSGVVDLEILVRLAYLADNNRTIDAPLSPRKTYLEDDLLAVNEAAAVLRMSPKTLANYRTSGVGPVFVKTGSRIRYRYSDLTAFIELGKRTSTSDIGAAK